MRRVGPFTELADITMYHWSCTRCSRQFPVSESYALELETGRHRARVVVCPDCARRYEVPREVKVDLTRLSPPEQVNHGLKPVAAHAWFVSNVRAHPPEQVLQLRDADVRRLAEELDRTPSELIEWLEGRGVLAA